MGNNIETSTKYANTVEINSKFTKEGATGSSSNMLEKLIKIDKDNKKKEGK